MLNHIIQLYITFTMLRNIIFRKLVLQNMLFGSVMALVTIKNVDLKLRAPIINYIGEN